MFDDRHSFVSRAFLRGELDLEFKVYAASDQDAVLLARLKAWSARPAHTETQLEAAFIQTFFVESWGHVLAGGAGQATLLPKLQIPTEGEADLALGWFGGGRDPAHAQVLCEFKDIRSKLDAKQNRKGKNRTPVEQCLDYLRGARRNILCAAPVEPWWGLVPRQRSNGGKLPRRQARSACAG